MAQAPGPIGPAPMAWHYLAQEDPMPAWRGFQELRAENPEDPSTLTHEKATLLGRISKNGRTYSDQALKDAVRLYDGVRFYLDHPTAAELRARDGSRSVLDLAGRNLSLTRPSSYTTL